MGRGVQPASPLAPALPIVSFEKVEDSSNKPHGVHDLATRSFGCNEYGIPSIITANFWQITLMISLRLLDLRVISITLVCVCLFCCMVTGTWFQSH